MTRDETPIENCEGCGKKTEPGEWVRAIPTNQTVLGMKVMKLKKFKCSKCGHEMKSAIVYDAKV